MVYPGKQPSFAYWNRIRPLTGIYLASKHVLKTCEQLVKLLPATEQAKVPLSYCSFSGYELIFECGSLKFCY